MRGESLLLFLVAGAALLIFMWGNIQEQMMPAPQASIKPVNIEEQALSNLKANTSVTFEAVWEQKGHPAIRVERWEWKLERETPGTFAGASVVATGNKEKFSYIFKTPGVYKLYVTLTNNAGKKAEGGPVEIHVYPTEPCTIKVLDAEPRDGFVPLTTILKFSVTHPQFEDLAGFKAEIDWGDGEAPVEVTFQPEDKGSISRTHEYKKPGTFTIKVNVYHPRYRKSTESSETLEVAVRAQKNYMMPAWSPDGKKIVVVFRDDASPKTYRLLQFSDIDKFLEDSKIPLSRDVLYEEEAPLIFPYWMGNNEIVFSANLTGESYDVYSINIDDRSRRKLVVTGYRDELFVTWYVDENAAGDGYLLYSAGRPPTAKASTKEERITFAGTTSYLVNLKENRNREATLRRLKKYHEMQVFKQTLATGAETQLTALEYEATYPIYWKENRFLFVRESRFLSANVNGSEKEIIDVTPQGLNVKPHYLRPNPRNPDYIAFMYQEGNKMWVAIRKPDGSLLFSGKLQGYYPSWSPDGQFVAIQVETEAGWRIQIYQVLKEENGELVPVGADPVKIGEPFPAKEEAA